MLKPAQLYKDRLINEYLQTWYKPENIFYIGWPGDKIPEIPDNNYDSHHFVSIDKDDNLIGYISYSVDWVSMNADRFGIISFQKGNLEFAKDVYQVICDLFEKYHMNRISWCSYVDNPAIRGYRNFIKKHGGRECAYHRQIAKLQDGKLHDTVEFEILASEFIPHHRVDRKESHAPTYNTTSILGRIHAGEIVYTKSPIEVLDIGLVESVIPFKVCARCSKYSSEDRIYGKSVYGGVEHCNWYGTGIYKTFDEWWKLTIDGKSTEEICNILGISYWIREDDKE